MFSLEGKFLFAALQEYSQNYNMAARTTGVSQSDNLDFAHSHEWITQFVPGGHRYLL